DHVRGGHNKVFGGTIVVLGGDFRILPVISNGCRYDVVTSDVEQLRLFTNWLLDMVDGRLPIIALDSEDEASWITIPDDHCFLFLIIL
nr:uncharacterized protein [Tanacetum cinerariifolium]